jgi:hypothetical protein
MQLVNSLQGAVAIHVAADEVTPSNGLISEQLIEFVGNAYNFTVRPQLPRGIVPSLMLPYIFQSGSALLEENRIPVHQLVILANGDIVGSATTDFADKIMNDYLARLDAELGYRFAAAKTIRRTHQSHIVVDFECFVAEKIEKLGKIEKILAKAIHRPKMPFKLKRLAFGSAPAQAPGQVSLDAFENADFLLERRESDPPVENRYYSAATTTTSEHLRILEAIEHELCS